jgi:hypothetical protein
MGLWPVVDSDQAVGASRRRNYSPDERRQYALRILDDTRRNYGREKAFMLHDYFARRGIESVPPTALFAFSYSFLGDEGLYLPRQPAMIFAVVDRRRTLGIHVTWLNEDVDAKRDEQPQRQTYGLIEGGYIE